MTEDAPDESQEAPTRATACLPSSIYMWTAHQHIITLLSWPRALLQSPKNFGYPDESGANGIDRRGDHVSAPWMYLPPGT
jgi:hypothetical protein